MHEIEKILWGGWGGGGLDAIETLPLVAIDSTLENTNANVKHERNFWRGINEARCHPFVVNATHYIRYLTDSLLDFQSEPLQTWVGNILNCVC